MFAVQRRFATPVPSVADLDALNRHLLRCCLGERERTVSGRPETIGAMFERERRHAVEMPPRPFDAAVQQVRQADKYQTVLFGDVRYSVPRHVAFEPVTVKAYVERVVLVHKGQVVARHRRGRTPGEQVLEPTHFLAVLSRKPGYLDHTRLFKELKLPPAFGRCADRFDPGVRATAPARGITSACCNCSAVPSGRPDRRRDRSDACTATSCGPSSSTRSWRSPIRPVDSGSPTPVADRARRPCVELTPTDCHAFTCRRRTCGGSISC